jgi:hypothetical protein
MDDDYLLGGAGLQITKIRVGSAKDTNMVTLWTGTLQVKSKTEPYGASIALGGTIKKDYFNTDDDTYVTTSTINWNTPVATTCTLSGGSNITVSSSSSQSTSAFSASVIQDQYKVNWYQDPVISTYSSTADGDAASLTGYSMASKKLTVAANTNYEDGTKTSRTVYVQARAGSASGTVVASKAVTITNATYNYNFVNGDGKTTTTGRVYSSTGTLPTPPTISDKAYDSTYHYTDGK